MVNVYLPRGTVTRRLGVLVPRLVVTHTPTIVVMVVLFIVHVLVLSVIVVPVVVTCVIVPCVSVGHVFMIVIPGRSPEVVRVVTNSVLSVLYSVGIACPGF